MSVDYYLRRKLSVDDVTAKTDITIFENENGSKFLCRDNGYLFVSIDEQGNFDFITSYGGDPESKIFEVLIPTFKVKFITDRQMDDIFYDKTKKYTYEVIEQLYTDVTKSYGYEVD